MKLKYIEERISPYFIFGENKDGFVDIANKDNSTLVSHISKEDAENIIKDRKIVIKLLHELSQGCGESFNKVWYK